MMSHYVQRDDGAKRDPSFTLTSTHKPGMESSDGVTWTKIVTTTTQSKRKRRHYRQVVY